MLAMAFGLLTACQTTSTDATKLALCTVFGPITYSSRDTPETTLQIRQHNAAYDSYCKGQR